MKRNFLRSRWYILGIALLTTMFIGGASRLCLPVLFKEMSLDLNLDLVAIGTIWGMDSLAGFFISLPGGLLLDRFGIKKTAIALCLLAAVIGAVRGLSQNFAGIAVSTFAYGALATFILLMGPKISASHFQGKYLALANALFFVFQYIGQMTATITSATIFSPLLGGWRNVLFMYSIPIALISIFWITAPGKAVEPEYRGGKISLSTFKDNLLHVIHIKEVWILGLILFAQVGTLMSVNGYLPLYLRNIGWDPALADSALTLLLGVSCIGTVPIATLSGRMRGVKTAVILIILLMAISLGLLYIAQGTMIWVLLLVFGLLRGVPGAMINTLVIEMEGIGSKYIGTAMGLMVTISMVGGFILPPLGNSMEAIDPAFPFLFWGFILALFLICFFFIRKPSPRK